jgi:hypothetical protein
MRSFLPLWHYPQILSSVSNRCLLVTCTGRASTHSPDPFIRGILWRRWYNYSRAWAEILLKRILTACILAAKSWFVFQGVRECAIITMQRIKGFQYCRWCLLVSIK